MAAPVIRGSQSGATVPNASLAHMAAGEHQWLDMLCTWFLSDWHGAALSNMF